MSILYARITEDGMGTGDALDASGIDGVENYDVDFFNSTAPDSLPYAKRFVKVAFTDYLKETK